jgi:hypothetical protein
MRKIITRTGMAMALLLNACGQDPASPEGEIEVSPAVALAGIEDCVAEARTCAAAARSAADGQRCADKLRACIGPLVTRVRGRIRGLEGSFPVPQIPIPGFDGGFPVPRGNDKVRACVMTLDSCLAGNADPKTCAAEARACVRAAALP